MPRSPSAPEDRLRAIELLLLWEGRVSRGRLLELFDVHGTMASRDIGTFRKLHPDACTPTPGTKAYDRTPWMKPIRTEGRFADYQRMIGAGHAQAIVAGVPVATANVDITNIAFCDYAVIHEAIRDGRAVQMTYRSLSNPAPHLRRIRPHTLIQAGPRWHVRGWCERSKDFRDFNLGRLSGATLIDEGDMPDITADESWNTTITVRLAPHRNLDAPQQQLVRDEYMQGTAALRFDLRMPMLRYLIQAFHAALDPDRELPPDYLLMVSEPDSLPSAALWIH